MFVYLKIRTEPGVRLREQIRMSTKIHSFPIHNQQLEHVRRWVKMPGWRG